MLSPFYFRVNSNSKPAHYFFPIGDYDFLFWITKKRDDDRGELLHPVSHKVLDMMFGLVYASAWRTTKLDQRVLASSLGPFRSSTSGAAAYELTARELIYYEIEILREKLEIPDSVISQENTL